jgi:hypothetical protein
VYGSVLTGLKELLARVAMQAASAMGFNPASARAAAQETTVGAKAAMHSATNINTIQVYRRGDSILSLEQPAASLAARKDSA